MSLSLISLDLAGSDARRSGNTAGKRFSDSIRAVSSGSRLIDLKTDPAGRAIFNGLSADDSALGAATHNAQVGMAFLNTAAGGVQNSLDALVRMKELAVSVVDGSKSQTERNISDAEYQILIQFLDDTAERTRFNGKSLLKGVAKDHIKDDVTGFFNVTVVESIKEYFTTEPYAMVNAQGSGMKDGVEYTLTKASDSGVVVLEDTSGLRFEEAFTTASAITFNNGLVMRFDTAVNLSTNVNVTLTPNIEKYFLSDDYYVTWAASASLENFSSVETLNRGVRFPIAFDSGTYFLSSEAVSGNSVVVSLHQFSVGVATDGSATTSVVDLDKRLDVTAGKSAFTFSNGLEFYTTADVVAGSLGSDTARFFIPRTGEEAYYFQVGEKQDDVLEVELCNASAQAFKIDNTDVLTVANARHAQASIDAAIDQLGILQSKLGAQQSGLSEDIERMTVMRANVQANMDVIGSADIAQEVANIAKYEAISHAAIVAQTRVNEQLGRVISTLFR